MNYHEDHSFCVLPFRKKGYSQEISKLFELLVFIRQINKKNDKSFLNGSTQRYRCVNLIPSSEMEDITIFFVHKIMLSWRFFFLFIIPSKKIPKKFNFCQKKFPKKKFFFAYAFLQIEPVRITQHDMRNADTYFPKGITRTNYVQL